MMAYIAKETPKTIKINIKLPKGVTATAALVNAATKAANEAVNAGLGDYKEALAISKELAKKGISMTADEVLQRRGKKRATKSAAAAKSGSGTGRKRVVLTDAQKKAAVAELKKGAKTAAVSKKFGVSSATVMNIKRAAGLTKARGKKK